MAINSRKAARQALATLFSNNIATLVAVYDHETPDFGGRSPVLMIWSDGTAPGPAETFAGHFRQHRFNVSIWWLWENADTTEDDFDDLSEDVIDTIETNDETDDWASLWLVDDFSVTDYPILDGEMYRRETFQVIIW